MKSLTQYIQEAFDKKNFPYSGMFKKGDKVVIMFLHDRLEYDTKNVKVDAINVDEVEKVVSKQLGRYRHDNHTWVYASTNGEEGEAIRFELVGYGNGMYDGVIDVDCKRNFKNNKNLSAVILKPETAKEVLTKKQDLFDFSNINKEDILSQL